MTLNDIEINIDFIHSWRWLNLPRSLEVSSGKSVQSNRLDPAKGSEQRGAIILLSFPTVILFIRVACCSLHPCCTTDARSISRGWGLWQIQNRKTHVPEVLGTMHRRTVQLHDCRLPSSPISGSLFLPLSEFGGGRVQGRSWHGVLHGRYLLEEGPQGIFGAWLVDSAD